MKEGSRPSAGTRPQQVDPGRLRQLAVLHVDLLERLDVLRHERDGHRDHGLAPPLAELPDRVVGVGLEPLHGPDPALVRQDVFVLDAVRRARSSSTINRTHSSISSLYGSPASSTYDTGTPCAEKKMTGSDGDANPRAGFLKLRGDELRHGGDVPGALVPTGDHRVRHLALQVLVVAEDLLEQTQELPDVEMLN